MHITMDDGVELSVEVAGDGPGLVLVHGFGGAKEDFADHVAALSATHMVVIFDHRGHGDSDKPADLAAYSLERLRADTLGVADAVGLERFRLLGHSMGGMVARGVALARPERLDALIMMDTAPGPIGALDPAQIDAAAQYVLDNGKAALKQMLDSAGPLDNPAHQRVLRERPGYQEFNDRKWDDLSEFMWAAMARELAHQPDDLDAMRALDMPVLVIVGALDEAFLAPSRAMADAVPGAQLAIIPDAGHSPQFENPAAWYEALAGFLASVPATATA
jgi:pimeloyl-ACP methyl ester carboxylesterase